MELDSELVRELMAGGVRFKRWVDRPGKYVTMDKTSLSPDAKFKLDTVIETSLRKVVLVEQMKEAA